MMETKATPKGCVFLTKGKATMKMSNIGERGV
jgi:hypothetical protein